MMNNFDLTPDDPRLTAYALDELEPGERTTVEAALRVHPELRATVDEIRAFAGRMEEALQAEPVEVSTEPTIVAAEPAPLNVRVRDEYRAINGRGPRHAARKIVQFPQLYYVVAGLAAACFAVVVALREPPAQTPAAAKKVYQVVQLQPATETAAAELAPSEVRLPPIGSTDELAAGAGRPLLEQVRGENLEAGRTAALPSSSTLGSAVNAPPLTPSLPEGPRRIAMAPAERVSPKADTAAPRDGVTRSAYEMPQRQAVSGGAGGTRALAEKRMTRVGNAWAPYSSTNLDPGPRPGSPMPEVPGSPRAVAHATETYSYIRDNDFLPAAQNPLSTFSIDVDTASYANLRRFVQLGRLPPADAVRIEELINYFPYRYAAPPAASGTDATPFAASLEVASAPWSPGHRLVRIGLKGREVPADARPPANLVFLIDVSGSMNEPNKLRLVKESMRLLLARLRSDDHVAIVTYAGQSGLALPSTPVARSREILEAIDALTAGGSTNGAMGIVLAYEIAKANFARDGVNRVILCTDGDFNVGVTSHGELVRLIEEKARSGVFLTVLGFGMRNLKDATLESLADKGNGTYGYIDTRREAEKLLVEELTGTLVTIAKDVKIQVDFNPAKVASYRLIGYENRTLKKEDFNNDKVDAGEVGAGHTVTALYEIVPTGTGDASLVASVEESKYQPRATPPQLPAAIANELLTVRVRYKDPAGEVSRKIEFPLSDRGGDFEQASPDFKFSSALAAFGMILRESPHKGSATINTVIDWALAGSSGPADDPHGYRREFLDLARRVQGLLARG